LLSLKQPELIPDPVEI